MTRHRYGISALVDVLRRHFPGKPIACVGNKWAQGRTGAREGDTPSPLACLLLSRAFFLAPIYFLAPATQARKPMAALRNVACLLRANQSM